MYSGQIYNFKYLRAELEKNSIEFKTTSAAKICLNRSFYNGVEITLPWLEGMFAFYNKYEKTIMLARTDLIQKQLVDKIEELLFDSVRKQLIADALVGALYSSGRDSLI